MNKDLHTVFKHIFSLAIAGVFFLNANAASVGTSISNKNTAYSDSIGSDTDNPLVTLKLTECYPNPATAYINFKFDNSVVHTSKLFIYSFTGKQMDVADVTGNVIKISLNNYYRGLYMYQLRDTNGNILESGKFQVRN